MVHCKTATFEQFAACEPRDRMIVPRSRYARRFDQVRKLMGKEVFMYNLYLSFIFVSLLGMDRNR